MILLHHTEMEIHFSKENMVNYSHVVFFTLIGFFLLLSPADLILGLVVRLWYHLFCLSVNTTIYMLTAGSIK